jgi:CubicO group peptidase (beta-lactamase class C family)
MRLYLLDVPGGSARIRPSPSLLRSRASSVWWRRRRPSWASTSPSEQAPAFPTAAFADIREDPVSERAAAEFQTILRDMGGGGGMAATVMSADGTWSGAAGKADGVRDVRVDDQFAIASVTKSVTAAQVMQMVEAGELALDDRRPITFPPDLDFDTTGATTSGGRVLSGVIDVSS